MNRTVRTLFAVAAIISLTSDGSAGKEKKLAPKKRDVPDILKQAGEDHFPEELQIFFVGSVELGDTFYHIFSGVKKKSGYRIIIFDNTPKYLGYYESEYEAVDCASGEFYLNSGEVDSDGNPDYFIIPLNPKGPKGSTISINGVPSKFVSAPGSENEGTGTDTAESTDTVQGKKRIPIEFREWVITRKGTAYHKRAKFVKKDGFRIILQSEESGREASFILTELSEADKQYIEEVTK